MPINQTKPLWPQRQNRLEWVLCQGAGFHYECVELELGWDGKVFSYRGGARPGPSGVPGYSE